MAARDGGWVVVAEALLKDAVDAEHASHLALQTVLERAERRARGRVGRARRRPCAALADLELEEATARQNADRLPGRDVADLLRELTVIVHPASRHITVASSSRGCSPAVARHQRVSPAKYFAALRRISRSPFSSRTFFRKAAFSASSGASGWAGSCVRRPEACSRRLPSPSSAGSPG